MASKKRKVDGDLSFSFIRIQLRMAMTILKFTTCELKFNCEKSSRKINLEKKIHWCITIFLFGTRHLRDFAFLYDLENSSQGCPNHQILLMMLFLFNRFIKKAKVVRCNEDEFSFMS